MQIIDIIIAYTPRILNDIWFWIYKWGPWIGLAVGIVGIIAMVTILACFGWIKRREWMIKEKYLMRCRGCKL